MVKSGSFKVSQGSTAGRVGAGIGKGLAESIPKEVDRYRLSQGLQNLAKNGQNLNPLEAFAQASAIPGITPQMIQALPDLIRQQQLANSLGAEGQNQPQQFPELPQEQPTSGLTTRPGIEATRKSYVRPTLLNIDARAKELFKANPQRFGGQPEKAIEFAKQEAAQEQGINEDLMRQRQNQLALQSGIEQRINAQKQLRNAKIPGNVENQIIQKAITSILPENEGGKGLTDQEAIQTAGEEYDAISKDYQSLEDIGNWTLPSQKPSEIVRNLKSIRERFKSRGDLENLADTYIGSNGLSPSRAYWLAYPPSEIPQLQKTLDKIPNLAETTTERGVIKKKREGYNPEAIVKTIAPKLAEYMGKNGSPLAIAAELDAKGYDAASWLDYLNENRQILDLTERQARELQKPRSFFPNLNDIYLFSLSGQNGLVE